MAQGNASGAAASAAALAADYQRDKVTFQLTDSSTSIYFGFNTAAVSGEGISLARVGDTLIVEKELARGAINIIGNGGVVSYQTGNVVAVTRGVNPLPSA